jgi:ATP-dependent DNA helicase PIF1
MQHKKGTEEACVLQKTELIVWNECTMSHRHALEALDRTLKDIRGNQSDLGGVTLLLSDDFCQTLPIIPIGTPADELAACLNSYFLWQHVQRLQLSTDMKLQLYVDAAAGLLASKLPDVGNGAVPMDKEGQLILHMFQPKNS